MALPTLTSNPVYPVVWKDDQVVLIDQTRIPTELTYVEVTSSADMAQAIQTMIVRGAPAIGVAAAYGIYLGATEIKIDDRTVFLSKLDDIATLLRATRPTAVNLFWAIDRMMKTARETSGSLDHLRQQLLLAAHQICQDDLATCKAMGDYGLTVLPTHPEKLRLLTHCNAGALATAGYGTALGVMRSAWTAGRLERVYADETRPRLQGAKLTSWECVQEGIPVTVITDNMAAHCMKHGMIDVVVVGADRIAPTETLPTKLGLIVWP